MNRLSVLVCIFACTSLLLGCNQPSSQEKYQLQTTAEGKVFRIDKNNGDISLATPEGLIKLSDGTPTLVIGQYYKKEDGKFLKYIGNGRFEESEVAIRIRK